MSLIVKIMFDEPKPDHDVTKGFQLVLVPDGSSISFVRDNEDEAVVVISMCATREREYSRTSYPQPGNAYVLNEQGKTIAIRNNKSEIVPTAHGKNHAEKRARQQSVISLRGDVDPRTTAAIKRMQTYPESDKVFSSKIPDNMIEAFKFGMAGLHSPAGTPEELALGQDWLAVEFHLGKGDIPTSPSATEPHKLDPLNPHNEYVVNNKNTPVPTASLVTRPKTRN